jgi:hypothetical protein
VPTIRVEIADRWWARYALPTAARHDGYARGLAATEELKSMVDAPKERPAKKGKASGPNKRA